MGSWKEAIQVQDLADTQRLEMTCRKCGRTRYIDKAIICTAPGRQYLYLAEVERKARCAARKCNGPMRMAMVRLDEMSGFVGGMA